jgi:5-methylcytosine-specific restriction enzyme subunit McrC
VFENFVTESLSVSLERREGPCQARERHTPDETGSIDIRPDLLWRIDGRPSAVIDAKYKAERPSGFPEADLYQALAYATAYDLDRAHLIYAAGNEVASEWCVRHAGIRLTAHTLALDGEPEQIMGQIDGIASRIAASVPDESATRLVSVS